MEAEMARVFVEILMELVEDQQDKGRRAAGQKVLSLMKEDCDLSNVSHLPINIFFKTSTNQCCPPIVEGFGFTVINSGD